ncbi:HAUS augmin-like complex subunit 2 isoform X1 [Cygnus atratus]|uniref:HAUS augmin-like complex subunit 2 isoform X1 n=1 Tax=Cygnus atratus TaxID=8868 RepID=UPI0015D63EB8|nr:HAUS augmin-like complex subunit 2 isoform X1 [Cygnus atratus]
MATARRSKPPAPASGRPSGAAAMAERRRLVSAATAAASPGPRGGAAGPRPRGAAGRARSALRLRERGAAGAARARRAAAAGPSPWESEGPTAAAAVLAQCLAEGFVRQETLDSVCQNTTCFAKFAEREKIANIRAEINEKKLETEILQLERETADIVHPFYLDKKCQILQDMNRHLEAVLKEKKKLRKRLLKPICQENLPIKAEYHKYVVELLTEAVSFVEKLESHLQSAKSIPQIPTLMKNMDIALTKTEVLVTDLEELTEQILKWRELQKGAYSDGICNTAELDFGLSLT